MNGEKSDFSQSDETAWMKEVKPSQFYRLYVEYSSKAHQAVLEISSPESRNFLGEQLGLLDEETFYERVWEMSDDVRRSFLRDIIVGYETTLKETEARVSDFFDNSPLEEVPQDKLGKHIAEGLLRAMGRRKNQDR